MDLTTYHDFRTQERLLVLDRGIAHARTLQTTHSGNQLAVDTFESWEIYYVRLDEIAAENIANTLPTAQTSALSIENLDTNIAIATLRLAMSGAAPHEREHLEALADTLRHELESNELIQTEIHGVSPPPATYTSPKRQQVQYQPSGDTSLDAVKQVIALEQNELIYVETDWIDDLHATNPGSAFNTEMCNAWSSYLDELTDLNVEIMDPGVDRAVLNNALQAENSAIDKALQALPPPPTDPLAAVHRRHLELVLSTDRSANELFIQALS